MKYPTVALAFPLAIASIVLAQTVNSRAPDDQDPGYTPNGPTYHTNRHPAPSDPPQLPPPVPAEKPTRGTWCGFHPFQPGVGCDAFDGVVSILPDGFNTMSIARKDGSKVGLAAYQVRLYRDGKLGELLPDLAVADGKKVRVCQWWKHGMLVVIAAPAPEVKAKEIP